MKNYIEYKLDNGDVITIASVEVPPKDGITDVSRDKVTAQAAESFENALQKVKSVASTLSTTLRDLASPPDEYGVEFGVTFSAESGIIIASGSIEANFQINLSWKKGGTKA